MTWIDVLAFVGVLAVFAVGFWYGRRYQEKQCYLGRLEAEQRAMRQFFAGPGADSKFDPNAYDGKGGYV